MRLCLPSKMTSRFPRLVLCTTLYLLAYALALEKGEILDMSYGFDDDSLAFPGLGFFEFTIQARGPTGPLPWLEMNSYGTPEHIGTHLDAPAHGSQGKMRVDDIPLSRFTGPAIRVDISEKVKQDRDYGMTVKDLQDWEVVHGRIPDGSLLFVYTGWGAFYPDRLAYFGTTRNDTYLDEQGRSILHSPGVAPEAATWLVANRKISGLGLDAPSLDRGPSSDFMTHQILFGANKFGIENVANLDKLPNTGAKVYAFPMKIIDGSGAPVRIAAMLDEADISRAVTFPPAITTCFICLASALVY
ncbi:uncharacterized protein LOC110982659 [Acanthaster planci]|uniref:Uncharacterized protein LOC110982659 n=1 Tax=Acanthaster planci TaxID=133434 RepID=A0A8B7YWS5_ACAPL|nr:uncharacterized protein LOC110982659 [Acanthaster planci]